MGGGGLAGTRNFDTQFDGSMKIPLVNFFTSLPRELRLGDDDRIEEVLAAGSDCSFVRM